VTLNPRARALGAELLLAFFNPAAIIGFILGIRLLGDPANLRVRVLIDGLEFGDRGPVFEEHNGPVDMGKYANYEKK
jgi:hypothetical protein